MLVAGALLAWAVGCGSTGPTSPSEEDPIGRSREPIQGGSSDVTHDFAVAVVQVMPSGQVAICSGVLLAPNLVATARHCVSRLASTQIDCATSAFAGTLPASDMYVTKVSDLSNAISQTDFVTVVAGTSGDDGVAVPPGNSVCGNDLALLILTSPISVSKYVTPAINPAMTDHRTYTTAFTAIGYGVSSPTDTTGSSAGVRRIKENINIACIPNDPTPADCFGDPTARQFISPNEFEGGDGTCEGDSGSGAFDQGSFNAGSWVAFGVLSRGGVSVDGGSCEGSIYTRFDAWGQLIVDTANRAATLGGYAPPGWAVPIVPPNADASSSPGTLACFPNGASCSQDSDCCALNCIAYGTPAGNCFACDSAHTCSPAFGCQAGVCVLGASNDFDAGKTTTVMVSRGGGCGVGVTGGGQPGPWRASAAGLAFVGMAAKRRLRRRAVTSRGAKEGKTPS